LDPQQRNGEDEMTRWHVKGTRLYATQGNIQVSADVPIRGQYTDARAWLGLFRIIILFLEGELMRTESNKSSL